MIHPKKARQLLSDTVHPMRVSQLSLSDAQGLVLRSDITAPVDLPLFDQSAMDGYAVRFDTKQTTDSQIFILRGVVQAGDTHPIELKPGEAVRIFTGARVPPDADAVVMQEKAESDGKQVWLERKDLVKGAHIRFQGTQIKKGDLALPAGTVLGPGAIGFLASLGINQAPVTARPRIALISTGNELRTAGFNLQPGEIFESNLAMLKAALAECGIKPVYTAVLPDDESDILRSVESIHTGLDLLILSGGISVGDYDFAGSVLEKMGVRQVFHNVAQKPGKPLYFGTYGDLNVLALPGNPAAALTCFYLYVLPCIRRMEGHEDMFLPQIQAKISQPFQNKANRALFLKARYENGAVQVLEKQGSDMLHSFAFTNALVYIPEESMVAEGDMVETHLLPTPFYGV